MTRDTHTCPQCGAEMDFEPPHPAEPDTNTAKWNGGWACDSCDFTEELQDDKEGA